MPMEEMEMLIKQIIDDCLVLLNNSINCTPNKFVIRVILNEFIEIRDNYYSNNRILLLSKGNWKLWSMRTIIDSANYNYDNELFDKVRSFNSMCNTLGEENIAYKY